MISLLVLAFVTTVYTGPAFDDWRAARKAKGNFPSAKVLFMLPSSLRCDD